METPPGPVGRDLVDSRLVRRLLCINSCLSFLPRLPQDLPCELVSIQLQEFFLDIGVFRTVYEPNTHKLLHRQLEHP